MFNYVSLIKLIISLINFLIINFSSYDRNIMILTFLGSFSTKIE